MELVIGLTVIMVAWNLGLTIAILYNVLVLSKKQIKTIKIIRGAEMVNETIQELKQKGYEVIDVKPIEGVRHVYEIKLFKVR
jgi:hypothetical protein